MMENCYLCNDIFTAENNSSEHIILNAIGGKLKAKNLLCKNCNSRFGNDADKILAHELSFLSSFLEVKRDNGKIQDIKNGTTVSGTKYNLIDGHKPQISKPLIVKPTIESPILQVKGRDKKEVMQIVNGHKRNYPDLDVSKAEEKLVFEEYYVQEPINFNWGVGSDGTFKSLTKSAVNYYIYTQDRTEEVSHLFSYLKGDEVLKIAKHYLKVEIEERDENIFHLIHIENSDNYLYCYIELFGAYSFIVLLSEKYSGKTVNSTYHYDLINNISTDKKMNLNLSHEVFDFNSGLNMNDVEILKQRLNKIMIAGEKIKTDREIKNIINDGIERVIEKFGNPELFSAEMHKELAEYISNRFTQFVNRNAKIDNY